MSARLAPSRTHTTPATQTPATETPATQSPRQVPPPPAPRVTANGSTPGRLLAGYVRTLLVLLTAALALVGGLTVLHVDGWPTTAAVAGWAVAVAAWLQHRGWPVATAHLAAWAAPAAMLAPLAAVGWLAPAGLVLWGPVSAILSIALAAVYNPDLLIRPVRTHTGPDDRHQDATGTVPLRGLLRFDTSTLVPEPVPTPAEGEAGMLTSAPISRSLR